jgi:hypothetical protein
MSLPIVAEDRRLAVAQAANETFLRGLVALEQTVKTKGAPSAKQLLELIALLILAAKTAAMAANDGRQASFEEIFGP